jgi:hypothetical protein
MSSNAGLGVYFGVRELFRHPEILKDTGMTPGLQDKTVIVQGFGNGAPDARWPRPRPRPVFPILDVANHHCLQWATTLRCISRRRAAAR